MQEKKIQLNDEARTVCEVWTRVMGYYRPTSAFNKGKKSECMERKCFTEEKSNEQNSEHNKAA